VINNAAQAHLEGLGSVERVAHAKAEIFSGLSADGVAVINDDDAFASLWRQIAAPARIVGFGLNDERSDYTASFTKISDEMQPRLQIHMRTPHGDVQTELHVPGRHNVCNALAATACAMESGAPADAVAEALRDYQPVGGRLHLHTRQGNVTVIDDSYNANPASMQAAIEVLAEREGTQILVLGQMAELGVDEVQLHYEVGRYARRAGVDALYATGPLSKSIVEGFGPEGRFCESLNTWSVRWSTKADVLSFRRIPECQFPGARCISLSDLSRNLRHADCIDSLSRLWPAGNSKFAASSDRTVHSQRRSRHAPA